MLPGGTIFAIRFLMQQQQQQQRLAGGSGHSGNANGGERGVGTAPGAGSIGTRGSAEETRARKRQREEQEQKARGTSVVVPRHARASKVGDEYRQTMHAYRLLTGVNKQHCLIVLSCVFVEILCDTYLTSDLTSVKASRVHPQPTLMSTLMSRIWVRPR